MNVTTLAEQINQAAVNYRVGGLQELRAKLHGKRPRTRKIFSATTIFINGKHEYAFHDGGRTELQFNIGVELRDQQRWWRHGVAFSFDRAQSLPDPAMLLPKVERFNQWVRFDSDALRGFKMWHWERPTPSADRSPGEIPKSLVRTGVFVFLGARVPEAEIDVKQILRDFDRLYPLYEYIESVSEPENAFVRMPEEIPKESNYNEGSVQQILVNRYERDPGARTACIRHYGATCTVCGFDFGMVYGKTMQGIIHVHHLKPLSTIGAAYEVDPVRDLRPLCANCHTVVHRREPPYSLDEVRQFLRLQKAGT